MSLITKPMLADPIDPDIELKYPVLATPKLDGIRALRISSQMLSRKFKQIPNHHVRQVTANLLDNVDGELVLEGKTFNEIQSAIMSEDGTPDFRYYIFDYVSTSLAEPYVKRMERLEQLVLPSYCVKLLPKLILNQAELEAYELECLAQNHEGIMVRSPNGPYKCGRSTAKQGYLLKVKRFSDSEGEVVGFEEQMSNQNEAEIDELGHTKRSKHQAGLVPAGTLGKLILREMGNTPWKGQTFGLGTGFDAAQRQEIWDNRNKYMGKLVTYKYQDFGIKTLPRLPVFKGFRSADDLSE